MKLAVVGVVLGVIGFGCSMLSIGMSIGVMSQGQDANQLLKAGFKIIDPEGYEVEKFEGQNIDYWTKKPKP